MNSRPRRGFSRGTEGSISRPKLSQIATTRKHVKSKPIRATNGDSHAVTGNPLASAGEVGQRGRGDDREDVHSLGRRKAETFGAFYAPRLRLRLWAGKKPSGFRPHARGHGAGRLAPASRPQDRALESSAARDS